MEFSDSSLEFSDPLDAAISDLKDDGSYMERLIRLSQTFYYSPAATMRATQGSARISSPSNCLWLVIVMVKPFARPEEAGQTFRCEDCASICCRPCCGTVCFMCSILRRTALLDEPWPYKHDEDLCRRFPTQLS